MKLVAIPVCTEELYNDLMFPICQVEGRESPLPGEYERECFEFDAQHFQEMLKFSTGNKAPYRSEKCVKFIC